MRRAQSLRSHAVRASVPTISSDDLGVLKEEDSVEDSLRKQLLAKDRENDKLQSQILALQDQLRQRPPLEHVQALEREYKNLELLLSGTQRENERCMAELERAKSREKMLEKELARLAGENWQTSLGIPAANTSASLAGNAAAGPGPASSRSAFFRPADASLFFLPQAESTLAVNGVVPGDPSFDASGSGMSFLGNNSNSPGNGDDNRGDAGSPSTPKNAAAANVQNLSTTLAHIAQVRTLILGMEERMQARETRLTQEVSRAEAEVRRFETIRAEVEGIS